ncbi:hypothetical protein [Pseudactinotalea suaedae]|uniref:hypothetical protein n=1 Tax=Pseudactinotalea suaedae TaxID=1524924 RepID=UPI0012E13703|nr:hypothetical protein [Pseudactinotalea suaedae]
MPPSTDLPHGGAGDGRDGPTQAEVDRRFAELIGGLGAPPAAPPAAEPPPAEAPPSSPAQEVEPRPTLGGPRDYAPPDELDEAFQPPEPAPLGTADPIRLLAWTLAIAGPILLLLVVLAWPSAPAIVWLTLLAVTVVGWGVAFARLPRSRDDGDDGAVV